MLFSVLYVVPGADEQQMAVEAVSEQEAIESADGMINKLFDNYRLTGIYQWQ